MVTLYYVKRYASRKNALFTVLVMVMASIDF